MEERRVLKNGLVAIADPMAREKRAALYVGVDVGSKNDPKGKRGTAHFLEHMATLSNEHHTTAELAEFLEFNGIDPNADTGLSYTTFNYVMPKEKISEAMSAAFRVAIGRRFDRAEFQREKGILAAEIALRDGAAEDRFMTTRFYPRVYKGTILEGDPAGTRRSLKNIRLSDVAKIKRQFYVPGNMVVVATGGVNKEKFFREVGKTFGAMPARKAPRNEIDWRFRPGTERISLKHDEAMLAMALKVNGDNHKDAVGLTLATSMLGQGLTSLLYRGLRIGLGTGYTPGADYICERGNAVISMNSLSIPKGDVRKAMEVMKNSIAQLRGLRDEKYFEGRKNFLYASHLEDLTDIDQRAYSWILSELEKYSYDFRKVPELLKKMGLSQFREIMNRNLSGEPLIVIGTKG